MYSHMNVLVRAGSFLFFQLLDDFLQLCMVMSVVMSGRWCQRSHQTHQHSTRAYGTQHHPRSSVLSCPSRLLLTCPGCCIPSSEISCLIQDIYSVECYCHHRGNCSYIFYDAQAVRPWVYGSDVVEQLSHCSVNTAEYLFLVCADKVQMLI